MGAYLSCPKTEKFSEDNNSANFKYGLSTMQGWRSSMEDYHAAILDMDENTSFFAVYDGHGGKIAAKFCAKHLHEQLMRSEAYKNGDLEKSLEDTFMQMDAMMRGHHGWKELRMLQKDENDILHSSEKKADYEEYMFEEVDIGTHSKFYGPSAGTTALVALIQKEKIVLGNVGDSKCILARGGKALELFAQHVASLKHEKIRIIKAGGFIPNERVNGTLRLTRAIGDAGFKQNSILSPKEQIIIAWPDTKRVEYTHEEEFLILASDGICECMSSQVLVDLVCKHIHEGWILSAICEKIIDMCLSPTNTSDVGCDNMTIIIVQLKD